jgi:YqjK-like protein
MAMPNDRELQLLGRREQLVARSGQLRGELTSRAGRLVPQGLVTDSAQRAWQWVQKHPQWVVGGFVVLLVVRPQRLLRWAGPLVAAAQLTRQVLPLWARVRSRRR